MTTMIERVQSAIVNAALREGDRIDPGVAEECARAAIAAMREPTTEMVEAGGAREISTATDDEDRNLPIGEYPAEQAYRAMIDAALKPLPAE